jgi:hypothetical protein
MIKRAVRSPLVLLLSSSLLLLVTLLVTVRAQPALPTAQAADEDLSLLAIYVLAFDNLPTSSTNLTAHYTPTVRAIISATAVHTDRVAVILADRDGYGDTQVIIAQQGISLPVVGLPVTEFVDGPVQLDPTVNEFDMANGWYLGNFIRWARQLYPATTTLFSFVGHGAPLTPQLVPLTEGRPVVLPTPTPVATPAEPAVDVGPLPPRWGAHTDLTDYHSASLISVRGLAQALALGTDHGAAPLDVVDLLHCFSATIEELYELAPYASTIIAAPNYAYAAPTMLGTTLADLDTTLSPTALAQTIVTAYDAQLPAIDHPRLLVAVDATKIAPIKTAWDRTAGALIASFTADDATTRTRLQSAYTASAKYDTTICEPQEWQLAPPDALSDMADFAEQLAAQFGPQSPTGAWALTTTQAIDAAILARHARDGAPWFAQVTPAPQWQFPGAGIALFTDLAPPVVEGQPRFSWQAAWYTHTVSLGNPYPYAFVRPATAEAVTWADLLPYFYTEPITTTASCVPGFVTGRGKGTLAVAAITVTTDNTGAGEYYFTAQIAADQSATNPLLRFQVQQGTHVLFEEVIGGGYLPAGSSKTVQSSTGWSPPRRGVYTISAAIDVDNRFIEANEANNLITMTLTITGTDQIFLPLVNR